MATPTIWRTDNIRSGRYILDTCEVPFSFVAGRAACPAIDIQVRRPLKGCCFGQRNRRKWYHLVPVVALESYLGARLSLDDLRQPSCSLKQEVV